MKPHATLKVPPTSPYLRLEKQAGEALRALLQDVPFVRMLDQRRSRHSTSDTQIDVAFPIRAGKTERNLVMMVKSTGQAREARAAAEALARYSKTRRGVYGVFCAPYVSESAAKICQDLGIGYLDLAGNCRLAFDHVYVRSRTDARRSQEARRAQRSLYSPKAERVLRALLSRPRQSWKLVDLAKEAGVSLGQTSNVRRSLAERELIRVSSEGIRLSDPERLLDDWALWSGRRRIVQHRYHSIEPLAKVEQALAGGASKARSVLTQFSAAVRLAPGGVRYSRAAAYVRDDADVVARRLGLKPVDSGANVVLIEPYDTGVLYGSQKIGGVEVVSPAQCYLDLRQVAGRGEEAAQTLLEKVKEQWS